MRRRWTMWVVGLPVYVVLLFLWGTVLLGAALSMPGAASPYDEQWAGFVADRLAEGEWWASGLTACAIIAASQAAFLLPVVRLRPPQGARGRSLLVSLLIGAVVGALLTLTLAMGLVELVAALLHGNLTENPWGRDEMMESVWAWPGVLVTLVGSWVLWMGALVIFSRQLWADTLLGRLTVLLFGGTVVELLVIVPIDIMVRRRTDCYCATGTFFSMCFSVVAVLWLTGPGVVIAATAGRRRLARKTHCARCGHAKGPSPGPACPECGYEWGAGKGDRRDLNP